MTTDPSDAAQALDIALRAARLAGQQLLARFEGPHEGLTAKSTSTDLVSDADREADETILGMIRAERPGDAILSEESGEAEQGTTGLRWLVDPLDGTTNYLWGYPQWAVSIACHDDAGGLMGVVHDPLRGETFSAVRGGPAHLDGQVLTLEPSDDLGQALIGSGFGYDALRRRRQATRLMGVIPHVRDMRRGGSAALDMAWVACGRLDAYFEFGVNAWDVAAGAVIVTAAGGTVQDLPTGPEGAPGTLAARPGLAAPLRAVVGAAAAGID
ncbi:MAG: inositol monophosphatase family protein [Actinomycetota bacterium]|nr:inositol monophosphatase [Thermoleophilia bacterium]MDA3005310.1 inositol monophosphatase family protein [Actinomycetota bacterium]